MARQRCALLIPGFFAGDQSLLATWLRRLGHAPRRAGVAVQWAQGRERSRGGHFAKALASRCPDVVSQVVSLASGLVDPFDISKITRHVYRELAYTLVSRCGEGRLREEGTSAAPRSQR